MSILTLKCRLQKNRSRSGGSGEICGGLHFSSGTVVQLDITDEASIKAVHASVAKVLKQKEISGLDVLVNKCVPCFVRLHELTGLPSAASTLGSFEVFKTIVFCTVAVTDGPLFSNGAAILNISSGLGSMGLYSHPGIPILPAYASSKAALNMLAVLWAKQDEEKQSGIRVLSICPGT